MKICTRIFMIFTDFSFIRVYPLLSVYYFHIRQSGKEAEMTQVGMDSSDTATIDVMNQLAGLHPNAKIASVRALRPDVVRHTQGSYDTLLTPKATTGLTRIERAQAALRVAHLNGSPVLVAHYRQQLSDLGASADSIAAIEQEHQPSALDTRTAAILRHADLVTHTPGHATQVDLRELQSDGLSSEEIVTLSQLIAFLNYQVRVLAVVSLLGDTPTSDKEA
jgi:CMD domain protein